MIADSIDMPTSNPVNVKVFELVQSRNDVDS